MEEEEEEDCARSSRQRLDQRQNPLAVSLRQINTALRLRLVNSSSCRKKLYVTQVTNEDVF